MMKVILDECIPQAVKRLLDKKDVDASSVAGLSLPNRSDQMVLEYVQVGCDVFITSDRRMKNQAKFGPFSKVGIIYLRVEPWTSRHLTSSLEEFLQKESLKKVIGKSVVLRRHDWEFLE
jgi:predicted nuclease of predicted toxin-antitoxin system